VLKFYGYNKCDTCRKAKRWLESKKLDLEDIDITVAPPSLAELKTIYEKSKRPLKDFLNKSGEQYRALNMKEKVKTLSEEELLKLLSQNGRLLKRPLAFNGKMATVGFNEEEFRKVWA